MAYQAVFRRYELKYLLTDAQKAAVLQAMAPHMTLDCYGRTTIRNLYFDTDDYRLIRRSIEKPLYKEKLRVRSYRRADAESTVFVELKKKFDGVVYKRRLSLPEAQALRWLAGEGCPVKTQISREIDYFMDFYGTLTPKVVLTYQREAYFCEAQPDFRVTFDDTILCRRENISLETETYGTPLLQPGYTLMEIKCAGGIPLWMTAVLSRERIYKTSFSKYGRAYETMIFPVLNKEAASNA